MFLIFGSAGDTIAFPAPHNARILGVVDDERKKELLSMADVALNPILSDCGANVKMFDFMAMGLPVVTTDVGVRGIETGGRKAMVVIANSKSGLVERDRVLLGEIGGLVSTCVEGEV